MGAGAGDYKPQLMGRGRAAGSGAGVGPREGRDAGWEAPGGHL